MSKQEALTEKDKAELKRWNDSRKQNKSVQPTVLKSVTAPKISVKSSLLTVAEMKAMKYAPSDWVVEDLIRLGRRRPSLLAGKPESGKSTFGRQMCVAVTKGIPIIGRQTKRSPVIYWQTEDDGADVLDSWTRLGYDEAHDEKLLTLVDSGYESNNLDKLHDALVEHPDVRLVIVETLDDLLKMEDVKENTAARKAFDIFHDKIGRHFSHRTAFLCLTHLKKKDCDESGDMILGATTIRGRTDAKLYLKTVSDDDDRHILHATVRKGRSIPKTYLEFNRETEVSTLGQTLAEEKKRNAEKTTDRIAEKILTFFATRPNSSFEQDCFPIVEGNTAAKRRSFNSLVKDGALVKSGGTGVKGSPFVYRVAEMPMIDVKRSVV